MVDWPVIKSGKAISTMIDDDENIKTDEVQKIIKEHTKDDKARTISIE